MDFNHKLDLSVLSSIDISVIFSRRVLIPAVFENSREITTNICTFLSILS